MTRKTIAKKKNLKCTKMGKIIFFPYVVRFYSYSKTSTRERTNIRINRDMSQKFVEILFLLTSGNLIHEIVPFICRSIKCLATPAH